MLEPFPNRIIPTFCWRNTCYFFVFQTNNTTRISPSVVFIKFAQFISTYLFSPRFIFLIALVNSESESFWHFWANGLQHLMPKNYFRMIKTLNSTLKSYTFLYGVDFNSTSSQIFRPKSDDVFSLLTSHHRRNESFP